MRNVLLPNKIEFLHGLVLTQTNLTIPLILVHPAQLLRAGIPIVRKSPELINHPVLPQNSQPLAIELAILFVQHLAFLNFIGLLGYLLLVLRLFLLDFVVDCEQDGLRCLYFLLEVVQLLGEGGV